MVHVLVSMANAQRLNLMSLAECGERDAQVRCNTPHDVVVGVICDLCT